MTTQRIDNRSMVGFLVVALLVLGAGGCGNSSSTARRAIETDNQVPGWIGAEGVTYADEENAGMICDEPTADEYETGMPMGYQEPGYSDTMETGIGTDDEYGPGQTEDMDEESTSCYGEEGESTEITEESGMVDEDDSTDRDVDWTPAVTEEEESSQNNDMDESSMMPSTVEQEEDGNQMISEDSSDETGETSAVTDEEGTSPQTEGNGEGDSNTVAPWISGEDQTMPDPDGDDTISESDSTDDAPVDD